MFKELLIKTKIPVPIGMSPCRSNNSIFSKDPCQGLFFALIAYA